MANLSVRGLDERTARLLKESARKSGHSLNAQVIEFIRRGLGLGEPHSGLVRHTDLDHLAGTWTEKEAEEFGRRIATFEVVDEELWR